MKFAYKTNAIEFDGVKVYGAVIGATTEADCIVYAPVAVKECDGETEVVAWPTSKRAESTWDINRAKKAADEICSVLPFYFDRIFPAEQKAEAKASA